MKSDLIPLIYLALVVIDAVADALFATGKKPLSKIVEIVYKMGLFSAPILYVQNFDARYLVSLGIIYLFFQLALFDIAYNITAKLRCNFVGTTSFLYDEFMIRFKNWMFWVWRAWWLFLGIFIYIKAIR